MEPPLLQISSNPARHCARRLPELAQRVLNKKNVNWKRKGFNRKWNDANWKYFAEATFRQRRISPAALIRQGRTFGRGNISIAANIWPGATFRRRRISPAAIFRQLRILSSSGGVFAAVEMLSNIRIYTFNTNMLRNYCVFLVIWPVSGCRFVISL